MADQPTLTYVPEPPEWHLDWEAINASFDWIRSLKGCPQDPVFHAEGDVWIHQKMVLEALTGLNGWRELGNEDRAAVFWSGLLHDIGKPKTTIVEQGGSVTARGHSLLGARMARPLLWKMNVSFSVREQIVNIVRFHQLPFWLNQKQDATRELIKISQNVNCSWLGLMAEADILGRICPDQDEILGKIKEFKELARQNDCFDKPKEFCTPVARYQYCKGKWHQPDYPPYENFSCEVLLMSGLPGAGKDHWINTQGPGWPVISLDEIRKALGITPSQKQGKVIRAAREQAREYLRSEQSFIWNATNISRNLRDQCRSLFEDYGAKVTINYIETDHKTLFKQNSAREDSVPEPILEKLLHRWEVPDPYEAHEVNYIHNGEPNH